MIAAIVAVMGLNTWKKQLVGQKDYELAHRMLVSVFKYRDAIDGVRHPAMWVNEMPYPPEDQAKKMSREQIRFYGTAEAYQKRWDKVREARSAIYADSLEAEALWGNGLEGILKKAYTLEQELVSYIRTHLVTIDPDADERRKESYRAILDKKREVIYDDLGEEPDEYKKDFREAVKGIEEYLKPKLGR